MPSLKAAISYSISVRLWTLHSLYSWHWLQRCYLIMTPLQVLAQHRPWLHRILDYEDECFALVCAALDKQSLAHGSATFAESLYGLRRATRSQRLAIGPSQDRLSARKQQSTVLTTVSSSSKCSARCSCFSTQVCADKLAGRLACATCLPSCTLSFSGTELM